MSEFYLIIHSKLLLSYKIIKIIEALIAQSVKFQSVKTSGRMFEPDLGRIFFNYYILNYFFHLF